MAFVVFTNEEYELDRRELAAADLVVGRAPECDVSIRDILLSRTHCRLEKHGSAWRVVDLDSKNGTRVNGETIMKHTLANGDVAQIGRTTMTYFARAFEPAPPGTPTRSLVRPSDPVDALAGTVAGFEYVEPANAEVRSTENFPQPQPRPREPAAYQDEDLYTLLSELVSSSWDSIHADASRQRRIDPRELPRPKVRPDYTPPERLGMPCDLSLQVDETAVALSAAASSQPGPPPMSTVQIALSVIAMMLALAVFGMSAWIVVNPRF